MLNGLGFELPLLTSFPDTSNGSGKEVFFIARKVKLCESPSKAGGLPILIKDCIKYDSVENCIKKVFPCIKCFREKARKVVGEGEESCPK